MQTDFTAESQLPPAMETVVLCASKDYCGYFVGGCSAAGFHIGYI